MCASHSDSNFLRHQLTEKISAFVNGDSRAQRRLNFGIVIGNRGGANHFIRADNILCVMSDINFDADILQVRRKRRKRTIRACHFIAAFFKQTRDGRKPRPANANEVNVFHKLVA